MEVLSSEFFIILGDDELITMSLRKLGTKTTFFVFGVILLIPILFYWYQFGIGIWSAHDDWAKMGGALGGIYAPILSVLTLYVIYRQMRLQAVIHRDQMKWQKLQAYHQHGIYMCDRIKEEVKNSKSYEGFILTLQNTRLDAKISKQEFLELIAVDDISKLLQQLITLLRKLRHSDEGKEISFHLMGVIFATISIEQLHMYEMNMCRWYDMYQAGFNKQLCVFTDENDLNIILSYKNI
jgi:thiamine phosphate synthase YjbQ (UPF0047 family)